jgi:hypothetical protein
MDTAPAAPAGSERLRFSLKQLLLALGILCLVLAPTQYFGGVYLFSIAFSCALIYVCVAIYRKTAIGAVFTAFASLFMGLFLAPVFFTFGVHTFFNLLACIALSVVRVRSGIFVYGLCLTTVAVYGFAFYSGISEHLELIALKKSLPFESIAERLAFEDETITTQPTTGQPIQLAAAVAESLETQDRQLEMRHYGRAADLQQLHEHTAEQFRRAAGFGLMRVPSIRAEWVRLGPRVPLPMPVPVAITPPGPTNLPLQTLHQNAVYNFVDRNRTGYVRSRREVVGFTPHGLSSLKRDDRDSVDHPDWKVIRLELVSLLRQTEPRVYIAKSLPEMDKLADVPNRPLNTFEQSALPQLDTQQDVVVNRQPDRIEMFGALRAGKTCLECHHGDRGKLLGAFSYELVPLSAANPSASDKAAANLAASGNN